MIVIEEGAFYILNCEGEHRFVQTDDDGYVMEFFNWSGANNYAAQELGLSNYQIVVEVKRQIVTND